MSSGILSTAGPHTYTRRSKYVVGRLLVQRFLNVGDGDTSLKLQGGNKSSTPPLGCRRWGSHRARRLVVGMRLVYSVREGLPEVRFPLDDPTGDVITFKPQRGGARSKYGAALSPVRCRRCCLCRLRSIRVRRLHS